MSRWLSILIAMCAMSWGGIAAAHKPSDSYLVVDVNSKTTALTGHWDIALRDLEHAIGIDLNEDGAITWGEVKQRRQALVTYAFSHLNIQALRDNAHADCPVRLQNMLIDEHVDGRYAVLNFSADCGIKPTQLQVHYELLFEVDPGHRGLLDLRSDGQNQATVLTPTASTVTLRVAAPPPSSQLRAFIFEGISHIWHGYDHILFLLTLLLPAVVRRSAKGWEPRGSLSDSVLDVVRVVTAFTLSHSVTLSAAALGLVQLPSRWVESAIAVTVLLGALNNLYPVVYEKRWLVAFVFGLIHGFGFAAVMNDLGLSRGQLLFPLLGFNVGVEVGQLTIVVLLVPLAYALRRTFFYRRALMPGGAIAISAVAVYWIYLRAVG